MNATGGGSTFTTGLVLALALPIVVSATAGDMELFEPAGLGTALFIGMLAAVAALLARDWRIFSLGALVGAAAYYPVALVWAAGHGMSLGG